MSFNSFKPEFWSRALLAAEKKALVYGSPGISNDDYEGEISGSGTAVKINQIGDPTVRDYDPTQDLDYETLDSADQALIIDQEKYFAWKIDDVDAAQAAGDLGPYIEDRAAYKLADTADQFLAAKYTGVALGNILNGADGSTSSLTVGNGVAPALYTPTTPADLFLKVILPLRVKLDEALVPKMGRYIVFPSWAEALLEQTAAFTATTDMQGRPSQVFSEGYIGRVSKFDVYVSENTIEYDTVNNGYVVQAGHPLALTFAEQIVKTEAIRLERSFSDAVRGLHVYGGKLVRPDHIAVAGVVRPAGL